MSTYKNISDQAIPLVLRYRDNLPMFFDRCNKTHFRSIISLLDQNVFPCYISKNSYEEIVILISLPELKGQMVFVCLKDEIRQGFNIQVNQRRLSRFTDTEILPSPDYTILQDCKLFFVGSNAAVDSFTFSEMNSLMSSVDELDVTPKQDQISETKDRIPTKNYDSIIEAYNQLNVGDVVTGRISRITDYGLFVSFGVLQGMISKSKFYYYRFSDTQTDFNVGDIITSQVMSMRLDEGKPKIKLSRMPFFIDSMYEAYDKVNEGDNVTVEVHKIMDHFAIVSYGILEGIIDKKHLSLSRLYNIEENLSVGDKLEVQILKKRLKEKVPTLVFTRLPFIDDPWLNIPPFIKEGAKVKGTIVNIPAFGVMVELLPGLNGLVHSSRLNLESYEQISQIFGKGELLDVIIESIDVQEKKITLLLDC